jgi:hypothetical protein
MTAPDDIDQHTREQIGAALIAVAYSYGIDKDGTRTLRTDETIAAVLDLLALAAVAAGCGESIRRRNRFVDRASTALDSRVRLLQTSLERGELNPVIASPGRAFH